MVIPMSRTPGSDGHDGDKMILKKKTVMVRPMSRTPGSDDHNGDRMIVTMILIKSCDDETYEQDTKQ